ncbi:MAG: ethanolamine ammonia-lyase subunit EutC [Elusimicrobiota bacterium]|jgi:ethanolamine ammonia-lyase small subunit|nr:ethanolamine ammonia-lyase subunit EutC [Elusimicrobiota bacterium]
MISESELKKAVEAILKDMGGSASSTVSAGAQNAPSAKPKPNADAPVIDSGESLHDLGAIDLKTINNVPHPHNADALNAMRKATPARVAAWRAGPRYLTSTLLRFRADHALAMDAVFTDVSDEWIKQNNLPHFKTLCDNKDTFLTRPDLGRQFPDEELQKIKTHAGSNNKVVIYVADGLSTTAVTTNAMDTYKAICDGLQRHSIKPSAPFFVQYGRVGSQDSISEVTGAEVIVTLIGERPGLITAESMSAYMAYKATVNMPEARRTVISNIHKGGTPAVEAGGYIADIIKKMLDTKTSGLDLKL